MIKNIIVFGLKLFGFSLLILGIHYYILTQTFSGELYFPLWSIYCFQATLVLLVYILLRYFGAHKNGDVLKMFLGGSIIKMFLAIIFLLPLFLHKSDHTQLEVVNFFAPYFLFLIFEIIAVNDFLQKT